MNINDLGVFKLMTRKLDWLTQRQQVIAHNIANSDTPHYRANDLKEFTFKRAVSEAGRLNATATHSAHMQSKSQPGRNEVQGDRPKDAYEIAPDGNAVILEDQLMKVADTGSNYQMVINLYRKNVTMFRTALGRGGM